MQRSKFGKQLDNFLVFTLQNRTNQIVPEFTVDLKGATIGWATKDKSSKKNVLEVCLFVDTESMLRVLLHGWF